MASAGNSKPSSWPQNVEYLTSSRYSRNISAPTLQCLANKPSSMKALKHGRGPCARVRIKQIASQQHPACGEHGLFACQHLPPDLFILCYLGQVHTDEEADAESNYDLSLDRELGIAIDATHCGNEGRFINDYRGIADSPNAEFRDVWVEIGGGRHERRIGVFVSGAGKSGKRAKGIAKGEEILVSYGKGFWTARLKDGGS